VPKPVLHRIFAAGRLNTGSPHLLPLFKDRDVFAEGGPVNLRFVVLACRERRFRENADWKRTIQFGPAIVNAPHRGDYYTQRVDAFLDELSNEVTGGARPTSGNIGRSANIASFLAPLANPMDLDTAAVLLSLNIIDGLPYYRARSFVPR
jgi:hypothetical protein